jgi:hypothetical protein
VVTSAAARSRSPDPETQADPTPMKVPRFVAACGIAFAASAAHAQAPPPLPPPVSQEAPRPSPPPSASPAPEPAVVIRTPTGAEARGDVAPASRWQADVDRLDADLRLRLMSASDPAAAWLAGELEETDVESQLRHYAAARVAVPNDRLYLASLGVACMQPVRPVQPPCDAVDRLADWARRDADNGVPSLLLAGRAQKRGEADSAASFVEQAALAPRFDDYWSERPARWWTYLRAIDGVEPAVRAKAAANYAAFAGDLAWALPLRALCADDRDKDRERPLRMRTACASVGTAMADRGATFALRRVGARIAELNAADDKARALAQRRHAAILATAAQCAQLTPDFAAAFESGAAAERAKAVEQFAAWAGAQAGEGEVRACERRIAAARK